MSAPAIATSSVAAAAYDPSVQGKETLQLYSFGTPNGHKLTIFLEEAGLPYDLHSINIGKNVQFEEWYIKTVNPNSKIPALIDKQGPHGKPHRVFESGAILLYLARKYKKFLPEDPALESEAIQWLFWQMGGFGPMLGQMGHFWKYAPEDIPYAKKRYLNEAKRLFRVLNNQLEGKTYVVGDEVTIADFAIYPWARGVMVFYPPAVSDELGLHSGAFPNVTRYLKTMAERPGVQRGLERKYV